MTKKQISILAAFAAAKVDYAIVGGVAVNAHGYVRATNRLDIFIRPTEENARAAFGALVSLGVPLEGVEFNDLLDEEQARIEDTIYVLDCFEKNTARTERNDLHTAAARLSRVKQRILEERKREKHQQ